MRQKDEQKQAQIYQATLKLVSQVGLAGISIAAIAKEAKVGTGSVYTYYASKEALINAVYEETLKIYSKKLFKGVNADEPFKVAIKKVFINYLNYLVAHQNEWIFQEQYLFSPYGTGNIDLLEFAAKQLAPLYQLIKRGKSELIIKNIDPRYHVVLLHGFGNRLALSLRYKRFTFNQAFIDHCFGLFWDAIKA